MTKRLISFDDGNPDLRGFKDEGVYTIHENSKLTEQGVGLYGL